MRVLVAMCAACGLWTAGAATFDGVAANVNGETITWSDVLDDLRRDPGTRNALAEAKGDAAKTDAVWRRAVERLVDRRLILRLAADRKMAMQAWVVENRVREVVKENFGGDVNRLNAALADSNTTPEAWRERIREDLIVQAVTYQLVRRPVAPSPAEMRREYAENAAAYALPPSVDVGVILLKPEQEGGADVATRGKEVLARLEAGEDFAALARLYSADSHAKDGGLWKDVNPGEVFREEIVRALARLRPGECAGPIDLDGWGFLVKKVSETPARRRTFAEAYDDVAAAVREREIRRRYDAWIARLRAEAFVTIHPAPREK